MASLRQLRKIYAGAKDKRRATRSIGGSRCRKIGASPGARFSVLIAHCSLVGCCSALYKTLISQCIAQSCSGDKPGIAGDPATGTPALCHDERCSGSVNFEFSTWDPSSCSRRRFQAQLSTTETWKTWKGTAVRFLPLGIHTELQVPPRAQRRAS